MTQDTTPQRQVRVRQRRRVRREQLTEPERQQLLDAMQRVGWAEAENLFLLETRTLWRAASGTPCKPQTIAAIRSALVR